MWWLYGIQCLGYRAYNPLEETARKHCDNVQVVGCAIKAGNALVASRGGLRGRAYRLIAIRHIRPTMQEAAAGTIPAAASLGWQGPIAGVEGRF